MLLNEKDSFWSDIVQQIFKHLVKIHSTLNAIIDPNQNQIISKADSHFWQEVMKATTLMNTNRVPESIKTEPIWNNKHIQFKGHILFL